MGDESTREYLKKFVQLDEIHNWDIKETYENMIDGAIQGSKKQHMKVCNEIKITENEINLINNMPDTTTRKIAFIMLCMWRANGNKPFRTTIHQIANEIGINANGKKLKDTYFLLLREGFIYIYNQTAERRKRILEKMIEVDSQYGKLFIPYDSLKYAQHISNPTRKSSIAIWRYIQDYHEEPTFRLPSYYENMSVEEIEEFKKFKYEPDEYDYYSQMNLDHISLDYIKENIDVISVCYSRDDFSHIIDGEVFYQENGAHNKIKVLSADSKCEDGVLIDVNELPAEYVRLFGANKVIYGTCSECGCKIVKKNNRTKYCCKCKNKVRKEKVKLNMRNMRSKIN